MRVKDEIKQDAIIHATVDLVNEIGFAASSVAKIAKRANVSPATIYIYYQNKEDLLVSTYIKIKSCLATALLQDFAAAAPLQDTLRKAGRNLFLYISEHEDMFYFTEQFANSPFNSSQVMQQVETAFQPMLDLLQRGIDEQLIKQVPLELLLAHLFYPIFNLANPRINPNFQASPANIEAALNMAWDAIKL